MATPGAILLLAGAPGVVWLTWWVTRQYRFPGRLAFRGFQLACLWWLLAASVELMVAGPACKMQWAAHAWPAIMAVPTFWTVFVLRYVRAHTGDTWRTPSAWLLVLPPVLMWVLALSNPWHHAVYGPDTAPISDAPGAPLRYAHGPVFWLAAVYVYALMTVGIVALWRAARQGHGPLRQLLLALLAMTFVPWVANASYVLLGWTVFGFDPTPFSFMLLVVLFAWAIRRHGLFDLAPVARSALHDAVPDPAVVVDGAGRVVGVNPAAQRLLGLRADGAPLPAGWPVPWPGAQPADATPVEWTVDDRTYELHAVPLNEQGPHEGTLLYLRDITRRREIEHRLTAELAERERQLGTISELHDRLRQQSLRDPLTRLFNRGHVAEFFARERARAEREGRPLTLVLLDVDDFKRINDTHGHAVGDDVLVALSRRLEAVTRATDAVFRYGGEEFLMMWPASTAAAVRQRMQRFCDALREQPLGTRAGPLPCSVSVGIAQWPQGSGSLDELVQAADLAMYRAKAGGRGRVEVAPDIPATGFGAIPGDGASS